MINREEFYKFIEKAKRYCSKDICRNVQPKSVSDDINNLLKTDADYLYTIMKSIDEYNEPMFTDSEREYLKAVIKPFKNRVDYIMKIENNEEEYLEYLMISVNSITDYLDTETISLPYFIKGSKYVNMELNKKYTLKELGLED